MESIAHKNVCVHKHQSVGINAEKVYIALQWRHNERDGVLNHPASWLFTRPFIQGADERNIKALPHRPLWGEFTGDRWIPRTNGQ